VERTEPTAGSAVRAKTTATATQPKEAASAGLGIPDQRAPRVRQDFKTEYGANAAFLTDGDTF